MSRFTELLANIIRNSTQLYSIIDEDHSLECLVTDYIKLSIKRNKLHRSIGKLSKELLVEANPASEITEAMRAYVEDVRVEVTASNFANSDDNNVHGDIHVDVGYDSLSIPVSIEASEALLKLREQLKSLDDTLYDLKTSIISQVE